MTIAHFGSDAQNEKTGEMCLLQENWGRTGYESEHAEIVADLARTIVLAL